MKDYTIFANEELVTMIRTGEEEAYEQLFRNIRPITLHQAEMYRHKMDTYDAEDFIQEGRILAWKIINKDNYSSEDGKFSTYFGVAIKRELIRIYERYCRKNLICIEENEGYHGEITRTLVISDYAERQREKARERNRRYQARKREKAGLPPVQKKEPMSREEYNRRRREYRKRYYAEHPEKLEERREKNRIRERERQRRIRAEKKAAKLAAMATI